MLAKELAPHNVTVNAVCPGSTDTDMMDGTFGRTESRMGLPEGAIKQMVQTFIPLGRQAETSEMAGIVAYLASDAASYITGQSIMVDGGILMR
jgi:NAD(P)-dependent dehydrogenase (short-subunit alcohol dehydrogenase family)